MSTPKRIVGDSDLRRKQAMDTAIKEVVLEYSDVDVTVDDFTKALINELIEAMIRDEWGRPFSGEKARKYLLSSILSSADAILDSIMKKNENDTSPFRSQS